MYTIAGREKITKDRIRLNRDIFEWCVRSGQDQKKKGNLEKSLRWYYLASKSANWFGCGQFSSCELETGLREIAKSIGVDTTFTKSTGLKKRWLHVFTEAYPVGGHTALATRWIELDSEKTEHSVAITFQDTTDAEKLVQAVKKSNGTVHFIGKPGLSDSLVSRAEALRKLAWEGADYVVLHTHMWDVIPAISFGINGGPPVLILNHADHTFWVGSSVADKLINIRQSGAVFAREYRGADESLSLPIPLNYVANTDTENEKNSIDRQVLREDLGIPQDARVLLTIGSEFKYSPTSSLNFLEVALSILTTCHNTYLIAVGPSVDNKDWLRVREATNGRLVLVGVQQDLEGYHRAADIYIEGFPFGSLTALLEAGLSGLPCVQAPQICPLPFRSDGAALEHLPVPIDTRSYVNMVVDLIGKKEQCESIGLTLSNKVASIHCGVGWLQTLEKLKNELPVVHQVREIKEYPFLPYDIQQYWLLFLKKVFPADPLAVVFREAGKIGLYPRLPLHLLALAIRTRKDRGADLLTSKEIFLALLKRIFFRLDNIILWRFKRSRLY